MLVLKDTADAHSQAALAIKGGGVVAFRTDTFYGLGADPFNRGSLRDLNALKGREGKPILVLVSDAEFAEQLVLERSKFFNLLAESYWPGPLTVVARARADVPAELTAGTGNVGVRLPDDERVRAFVRACGGALTATSANPAGSPPARSCAEVKAYFRSTDLVLIDGGETSSAEPSTVVEASSRGVRLIREGLIKADKIRRTLLSIGAELD